MAKAHPAATSNASITGRPGRHPIHVGRVEKALERVRAGGPFQCAHSRCMVARQSTLESNPLDLMVLGRAL